MPNVTIWKNYVFAIFSIFKVTLSELKAANDNFLTLFINAKGRFIKNSWWITNEYHFIDWFYFLLAISSTPTSSAVTTYGKPHGFSNGDAISSIESPSTHPVSSRMQINPTINTATASTNPQNTPSGQRQRLRSLDTFRGWVNSFIILMGDAYYHPSWLNLMDYWHRLRNMKMALLISFHVLEICMSSRRLHKVQIENDALNLHQASVQYYWQRNKVNNLF